MKYRSVREDFKSDEEYQFALWCEEAEYAGFIKSWKYEPKSFLLSKKAVIFEDVQLKTKVKKVQKHLFAEHSYTPDFAIVPNSTFTFKHGLKRRTPWDFDESTDEDKATYWIDVKGTWVNRGGTQEFSINQKWMYAKYGVIVNKVIPCKFFDKTWVPLGVAFGKSGKRLKPFAKAKLLEEIL